MVRAQKQIRPWYKLTEVGIIPEDWEIKEMREMTISIASWKSITSSQMGDYPIYGSTGIIGYRKAPDYFGDKILIARVWANAWTINQVNGGYCVSDNTLMATFSREINIRFSYYQLQNFWLNRIIFWSGQPLLTWGQIKDLIFPIPKLKEQSAIAQALSDTDNLITSLDALIEKKRSIKQGAMQELLTGRRRLPGFSGEWEEKSLKDIGEIAGSGVDKLSNPNETPVRLLNYMDVFKRDFIYSKELNHWVTAKEDQYKRCSVKKGDVFFTPSSEMRYDIALSAVAMEDIPDAVYSYHVVRFRIFDDWDLRFKSYIFKTKLFIDQAEKLCEWSGKRYVINQGKFRIMKVKFPVDKSEQSAIAQILSDMDTEIQFLEAKRDKYKSIKQGMMSELLTGNIRLLWA